MDRRTLTVLAIAALTVLAIGLAAATLTSTVAPEGDGDEPGSEQGLPLINETDDDEPRSDETDLPGFFEQLLMVIGLLAALGMFAFLAIYRTRAAVVIAVIAVAVLLLVFLLQAFGDTPDFGEEEDLGLLPGEGGEGEDEDEGDGDNPLWNPSSVLTGVFVIAMLAGMYLLYRVERADTDSDEESTVDPEEDAAAIGAIAGRAADRIEDDDPAAGADAENAVYRAWREMTEQLDIESEDTTTPREFQMRAVEAGMAPDDVRELTELFEQVRYGGEDATETRERRAVDVLRRIESAYGEEQ